MTPVVPSKLMGWSERRSWQIVLVVALLHLSAVVLFKYGFPDLFKPKKSEITIELGGSVLRGEGGTGVRQIVAPSTPNARKSATKDELATKRATDSTQSAPAQAAASSAAAGIDAAPTMDADYKAAYLNNPKPPYPSVAFQMRIEGTVMLKALVLPDGSCGEVLLAKSSGNSLLDDSALRTVAQWKFVPAKSQGKEISQWVSIPITFALKRRSIP